ncbi:MAG: UDP-N-acetylmuramoyl-L-alanyl-D-glutamate--2,6-diaminopimelate ligase [Anaerolineae bacterium]|nr:UDP-N-acetylmuramoyl-L-alanyl-D-glutamate--2,6-diaminopimelate ligase [Anaerolineae bacterium]
MKLSDLIRDLSFQYKLTGNDDPEVHGIASDSRQVRPGYVFVALVGGSSDGHRYIKSAKENGAVAVVGTQATEGLDIPYLQVEESRMVLPYLAAAYYGYPARKLTMIGVTGTDGKTTTTNMIYQILLAAGLKAGMISTINAVIGEQVLDTGFHVTTPDAPDVQRYLAQMVEARLTHVVLEVTSHGLAQYRADACEFDIAVVTNITHEHLDYHGSYEAYRSAKARLFTNLGSTLPKPQGNPRLAVLNRDDASFEYLDRLYNGPKVTYGTLIEADVRPLQVVSHINGVEFQFVGRGLDFPLTCNLTGVFNIHNSLAATAATVIGLGLPMQAAQEGNAALKSVPGRMESIDLGQNFAAIVDFAHTPNALENALRTARQLTRGRVIAIFGAAGLRDRQKRRMMAATSVELADISILTAEDPRTELLDDILEEMAAGAASSGGIEQKTFWRIPDRGQAIRFAISLARPGDVVISCGKGHEQSMCFGEIEYDWDDRTAMRAALSEHLGVPGPKMPYLPTQEEKLSS